MTILQKGKCLISKIIESHANASSDSISKFDTDLSQAATDSKSQDWDLASMY